MGQALGLPSGSRSQAWLTDGNGGRDAAG